MASFFSFTPSREAVSDESVPFFSGMREASGRFNFGTKKERKELIQLIKSGEDFYKKCNKCSPATDLSSLEQMTLSELKTAFQDLNAETVWKKKQYIKDMQNTTDKESTSSTSVLKQGNVIWIDAKVTEIKGRSRTREKDVETGTTTAKELDEIKEEVLGELSKENWKFVNEAAERNREGSELDRQEEKQRAEQQEELLEKVQNRMQDPRYRVDPQFYDETILLAKPFLEDSRVTAEMEAELLKFSGEYGYDRHVTQLIVLRRESRSSEAYGPVQILSKLRDKFFTLHAEPNEQETWLEETQKKLVRIAEKTAQNLAEEVPPAAVNVSSKPYEGLMPILKGAPDHKPRPSQESKKEVQFSEKVKARVVLPGDLNGDAYISLETMSLEDSKW